LGWPHRRRIGERPGVGRDAHGSLAIIDVSRVGAILDQGVGDAARLLRQLGLIHLLLGGGVIGQLPLGANRRELGDNGYVSGLEGSSEISISLRLRRASTEHFRMRQGVQI
jgi:hypothetical protein